MKKSLGYIALAMFFFSWSNAFAQTGYEIKLQVKGNKDSVCYFGNYFGDKQYIIDTAVFDNETVVFKGVDDLKGGLYLLIFEDLQYLELIVDKDRKFVITTDVKDLKKNFKIKGSKENERFYEYTSYLENNRALVKDLKTQKAQKASLSQDTTAIQAQIDNIDIAVEAYIANFALSNNNDFFVQMINSSKETPLPKELEGTDAAFYFYRNHYWDYIDLKDEKWIRTPIFHDKMANYVNNLTVQWYDSIIPMADNLISQTTMGSDLYKYIVTYITKKYEKPQKMGNDAVFVHMVDKYFTPNPQLWDDTAALVRMADRAETLRPNLVGKIAPNIKMVDYTGKYVELHSIDSKLLLLYFYSTTCSQCKKATPQFNKIYEKYKNYGLNVYAICTNDGNPEDCMEYEKTMGTASWLNVMDIQKNTNYRKLYDVFAVPVVYLLDENKRIIAKNLGWEVMDKFLAEEVKKLNMK